jgi:uncharacterized protein (DUF486 family)
MDNCKEITWMGTLKGSNSPIEITKFVIWGLCFFVHVVEYTIAIANFHCSCKNNYVIIP